MLPEKRMVAVNANSRGQICHFMGQGRKEARTDGRTDGMVTVAIEVSTAELKRPFSSDSDRAAIFYIGSYNMRRERCDTRRSGGTQIPQK